MIYLFVAILIIISAISKSIQDKLQFHFEGSIFRNLGTFWNPKESWKRKYKNSNPEEGPLFPGSTTIFVSLTDAWHLFGLIRNFSLVLGIAVASNNYYFLIGYLVFIITFHIFFTWIFNFKSKVK